MDKSVKQWVESQEDDPHHHTNGSSHRVSICDQDEDEEDEDEDEEEPEPEKPKDSVVEYIESELKMKKPQLEEAQSGALISVVQGLLSEENGDDTDTPNGAGAGNGTGTEMTTTATNGHDNGHHAEKSEKEEAGSSTQKQTADLMKEQSSSSKARSIMDRAK